MTDEVIAVDAEVLLEFMYRLGQAYLACGEQTAEVERLLRGTATAFGMRSARIVAFPTAVFITLHDGRAQRVTLAEGLSHGLRLDQIADIHALCHAAERAEVTPREGLDRLAEILRQSGRFGPVGIVAGHSVLSAGLAMLLMPTLTNLAGAAVLGFVVGLLKLVNRDRPVLALPTPVFAATLVSALTYLAVQHGLPVDPLYLLVPPLVTFLPGAMLTLGMVELAYGDMIAGTSRLITGLVQLVLLAFGLAAGAALVGFTPDSLVDAAAPLLAQSWVRWAPWVAVVVFGTGVYFHFSAPRHSIGWLLLVLLLTFGAQRLAASVFNTEMSGFFGMLVATPLGYLIQHRFNGPPAVVTYLPSFWLVVPGSLGLHSVTRMLSDRMAGIESLVGAIFAIASIALGTLVGASLYKGLDEHFGWWRVQVQRVSRRVRARRGR
jgi:uncharacterized membrane protein YjjP (DUF1212 family)